MPRLSTMSAINGIFDKIKVGHVECKDFWIPYSLLVANTESLPEEGECFETLAYIPCELKVKSIVLQINQTFDKPSNVSVKLMGKEYVFHMTPSQTTQHISVNMTIQKESYEKVVIENMTNDEGDVSACSVLLHGYTK